MPDHMVRFNMHGHLNPARQAGSSFRAEMGKRRGAGRVWAVLAISALLAAGCGTAKNDSPKQTDTPKGTDTPTENDTADESVKHPVFLINDAALTEGCQKGAAVEAHSSIGGLTMRGLRRHRIKVSMAAQASQADANTVVVTKMDNGSFNSRGAGVAFKCDDARLQSIKQAPGTEAYTPKAK
jgi:hypothetical protein